MKQLLFNFKQMQDSSLLQKLTSDAPRLLSQSDHGHNKVNTSKYNQTHILLSPDMFLLFNYTVVDMVY